MVEVDDLEEGSDLDGSLELLLRHLGLDVLGSLLEAGNECVAIGASTITAVKSKSDCSPSAQRSMRNVRAKLIFKKYDELVEQARKIERKRKQCQRS